MHGSVVRTRAYELLADDTYRGPPPMSTKEADAVMPTEDIPTPSEEEFRAQAEELDQRDALARYIELIPDPMHQPSKPRQRPRFAGESHDDYQLRGF